jgi:glyoxylase-like metal-dependent hydrolase (beta-lactamase superfamily II)
VEIHSLTVGPLQENTYLLIDERSRAAVLVDPGDEWELIADLVRSQKAELSAIWLTHAHLDHIGAVAGLKRLWDVPVHLHENDLPLYAAADRQAAYYGIRFEIPPPPSAALTEGGKLTVGTNVFTVRHTPGHSPGHVIFVGDDVIFGGDLVFMDSIGRTDLPLSNPVEMTGSLQLFATLPGHLALHPGHGPSTTVVRELASNPFLNGLARVVRG